MEVEEGNSLSESVFHKCVVCNRMFEDDINILDGYIEELVKKKYSLSTVMKMSYEFKDVLKSRRLQGTAKFAPDACVIEKNYELTQEDISKHVLFCVGTRSTILRHIICNTKAMAMLLDSSTVSQTSTAIKLLQTGQSTGKQSTNEAT